VRPCEANALPAKGDAREKQGLGREGAYVRRHVLGWRRLWVGGVYAGVIMAGVLCGEEAFVPSVNCR